MQIDKGHLWKLLHGEKPWRIEHLLALPDDIEACFEQRRAEAFGLIVVEPVDGDQALKNFVSGLLGVLGGPRLPRRAGRMAKAAIAGEDPSGGGS